MSSGYPEYRQGLQEEIKEIIDSIKGNLEKKIGKFTVVNYLPQMKEGNHYLVKVQTGPGEKDYSNLLIFKPKDGPITELLAAESGKTLERKSEAASEDLDRMKSGYPEYRQGSDKEIEGIIDPIKGNIECKIGKFTVVSYRPQMKEGKHYLVKVQIGQGITDYTHLLIFTPKDGTNTELLSAESGKTLNAK